MSSRSAPWVVIGAHSVAARDCIFDAIGEQVTLLDRWDDDLDAWRSCLGAIVDGPDLPAAAFDAPMNMKVLSRVAGRPKDRRVETEAAQAAGVRVVGGGRRRSSEATADFTVMVMLMLTRQPLAGQAAIRDGSWLQDSKMHIGVELSNLTVGLIGFGAVGQAVARRLAVSGAKVVYTARTRRDSETELQCQATYRELGPLLAGSDIVSLHLRCPDRSWRADRTFFAEMRPGAWFVNTSRGYLVDETALLHGLDHGTPGAAALDVFDHEPAAPDHPLVVHERVLATPHLAGSTVDNARMYWGSACVALTRAVGELTRP